MPPLTSCDAADLIFTGGSVVTVDAHFSTAQALAVKGNRVQAVGESEAILGLAGSHTRIVDLAGGSVLPGINDSHIHLSLWALGRPPYALDLAAPEVTATSDIRRLLGQRVREVSEGEWIRGVDWSEDRLVDLARDRSRPSHDHLDPASPGNPVVLEHWTRHALWVNGLALRAAGIDRDTPDPAGGTIVRDTDGEPTGELLESACDLVLRHVPPPGPAQRRDAIAAAARELNRRGVTSITDPVVGPDLLRDYQALRTEARLPLRVSVLLHWDWPSVRSTTTTLRQALSYVGVGSGFGDEWLRIGGAKLFADGVPKLGTAWMSEPTLQGKNGTLVTEGQTDAERSQSLAEMISLLHSHRLQVQVHATGDLACQAVTRAFDAALSSDPWEMARHVVIHGNFLSDEDLQTLARHGLVCNVNSLIKWQASDPLRGVLSDAHWHENMRWGSAVRAGVHVADSSDAPITEPDWCQALETLVLRETRYAREVSGADQRISREQAIRAWTIEPAYQEGLEAMKGSLEPGKLADLVVLEQDVLRVADHELHTLRPTMTVLNGQVVHESA